jgi:hypothetical protein
MADEDYATDLEQNIHAAVAVQRTVVGSADGLRGVDRRTSTAMGLDCDLRLAGNCGSSVGLDSTGASRDSEAQERLTPNGSGVCRIASWADGQQYGHYARDLRKAGHTGASRRMTDQFLSWREMQVHSTRACIVSSRQKAAR